MRTRAKIGALVGILAAVLAFASCGCPRHCPCAPSSVRDSVYLEIRDSVIIRDTLLPVQLPADTAQVEAQPADTARAETSAAAAIAFLDGGAIRLEIWNKPAPILVPVQLPAMRIHWERSGEAHKLTRWQEIRMDAGVVFLSLLVVLILWGIISLILNLKGISIGKK